MPGYPALTDCPDRTGTTEGEMSNFSNLAAESALCWEMGGETVAFSTILNKGDPLCLIIS